MSKTYTKNDDLIKSKIGEVFTIELESNPTTGYQWQESFDTEKVKLLDKKVKTKSKEFGGSGKEILTFQTVGEGNSIIKLSYKRSWENSEADSANINLQTQK